ncbi:MAG: DUF2202 domain-containing protein [Prolixibacteraceae bacterium]|nr:DUF2202 domain-containing protein [Prolixibacteraceae bacterium]
MRTSMKSLAIGSLAVASLLVVSSCQKGDLGPDNAQYASVLAVAGDGVTSVIENNLKAAMIVTPTLTDAELASLLEMKEEEKLARDVYSALFEKWGQQVFSNISAAENNHLNAIVLLLNAYEVGNTAIGDAGVFSDPAVQALYADLVAKGSVSVEEAFKTGALIEEMDIRDLSGLLASTTNENVTMVFENLLKGSRNHLRAFNLQLQTLGLTYTPVYISADEFTRITTSPMEKGKQYKMQGNGTCTGSQQQKRKGRN